MSPSAPGTPDTIALFGLPITNVTMTQAVSRIAQFVESGKLHQVATANLDFARNSLRDPYLQRIICECSMVLPDGAPMLWAASIFHSPLRERVTGVDLVPELARLSEQRGYGIFLLGSLDSVSRAAADVLAKRFPGMKIVGRCCPEAVLLDEKSNDSIIAQIRDSGARIVMVGFGNPKQEVWIHRHKDRLPAAVYIGIGGSLDIIAGTRRRAPRWMQKLNLEWCFRMLQEPMRLFPRYARDVATLLGHLPGGIVANRMQPFERRQRGSSVDVRPGARVVVTPGKLGGRAAAILVREAQRAIAAKEMLVIDMSATLRVEAEGVGGLLEARRLLLDAQLMIRLTSMSASVRRVLQISAVLDLFPTASTTAGAIQGGSAVNKNAGNFLRGQSM